MLSELAGGRYVIHREIARGGMASVHIGQLIGPAGFSRLVAIKQMLSNGNESPEALARFLDEAWLAARVQHPNVVSTLEVVADSRGVFIVMDHVRGVSLSTALKLAHSAGKLVPRDVAFAIAANLLAGLHAAHEARGEDGQPLFVVHRDVSPQNVLVGADGLARIVDFGVAKAATQLHVTSGGDVCGKIPYMSPEQLAADPQTDRRADVFAAGAVIWEVFGGRRLFGSSSNFDEMVVAVLTQPVPGLAQLRPDVPPALDAVLARALARDLSARFATADEFAVALEQLGRAAAPRVVSDWVRDLGREEITERDRWIREIEQRTAQFGPSSVRSSVAIATSAQPVDFESPTIVFANEAVRLDAPPEPSRSSSRRRLGIVSPLRVVGALGIVAGGALLAAGGIQRSDSPRHSEAAAQELQPSAVTSATNLATSASTNPPGSAALDFPTVTSSTPRTPSSRPAKVAPPSGTRSHPTATGSASSRWGF